MQSTKVKLNPGALHKARPPLLKKLILGCRNLREQNQTYLYQKNSSAVNEKRAYAELA